ncbi:hypothetical protein DY000_02024142 [Brassica cretica]|uniref:Large ribosomal subunit protein bL12 C-terminal domain-containing protein n=1 Tax=Brassica cretica TaxID=69181 RepID=A0ABQ7E6P8_BRACR|nr:hypothetical protein DY000_02024142 [Brassica cretica]
MARVFGLREFSAELRFRFVMRQKGREVAWAKTTEEKTSMSKFYLGGSYKVVDNVPSIVKQYITKEEAEDLAAKLNAAGGVAVIMEVDEEEAVIKEVDEEEG